MIELKGFALDTPVFDTYNHDHLRTHTRVSVQGSQVHSPCRPQFSSSFYCLSGFEYLSGSYQASEMHICVSKACVGCCSGAHKRHVVPAIIGMTHPYFSIGFLNSRVITKFTSQALEAMFLAHFYGSRFSIKCGQCVCDEISEIYDRFWGAVTLFT